VIPERTAAALRERLGSGVLDVAFFRDEGTAVLSKGALIDGCRFCHDELGFDYMSDLTCVDWLAREPRFDVVYHLMSTADWQRFRLKVQVNEDEPVPTVVPVWGAANWAEREVWDLFGIEFEGHPDLRRIMMPEGWIGFPLRKDYPQTQIALPRSKYDKTADKTAR
jgi:NADH-quinone oxidoreductase subunit C